MYLILLCHDTKYKKWVGRSLCPYCLTQHILSFLCCLCKHLLSFSKQKACKRSIYYKSENEINSLGFDRVEILLSFIDSAHLQPKSVLLRSMSEASVQVLCHLPPRPKASRVYNIRVTYGILGPYST